MFANSTKLSRFLLLASFLSVAPTAAAQESPPATANGTQERGTLAEEDQGPEADPTQVETEAITVWGEGRQPTNVSSPTSLLEPADLAPITAPTTEDLVKYEPSVIIRRRFIGDANGTIGMRGSNMFQTTRSMVFADGVPLHYFLQTRFSGSPRWSLVNKDEIGFVEVVYGPFSAEYGGNAMGGVVNIETLIPSSRKLHLEASLFNQAFDEAGFDDTMAGYKGFFSYGDRFEHTSLYAAYNHLRNDSQPMDWRFDFDRAPTGGEIPVIGSLQSTDEYGDPVRYYANSGMQDTRTDQFKLKVGQDLSESWLLLFNTGYEIREIVGDRRQNYLLGPDGQPVWEGAVVDGDVAFDVRARNFAIGHLDRKSLLLGGRASGVLSPSWFLETSLSYFDVLEDETRTSLRNPADPAFTPAGTVRDFDQAGWETADVKIQSDDLGGNPDLRLLTGYRYEHYDLGVANYRSPDFAEGVIGDLDNASGGQTRIHALFAQLGWQLTDEWDLTLGGRQESWESTDGFFNNRGDLDEHIDRSESRFSPKLSVGYSTGQLWRFRLSAARAYRFPIVEELFQNERRTNGTSIANANLEPEDGLHYNLLIERALSRGQVRVNLFTESVKDTIFNQGTIVDNRFIRTFLPIDEVQTDGAELIINQSGFLDNRLSVRFNMAYTASEIVENSANPDLEGKVFPRMPKWRSHVLLNYRINSRWDVGGGVRYASNSFGDADNSDIADRVFGAHDEFTQVNFRSTYHLRDVTRIHFGIDNLNDNLAYVHHPWPKRTVFLEFSQDWR